MMVGLCFYPGTIIGIGLRVQHGLRDWQVLLDLILGMH